MANFLNRTKENVPGLYFVDRQCIDCDLCRQTAPGLFKRMSAGMDSYSYVARQPVTNREVSLCERASSECPVEAIGKKGPAPVPTKTVSELVVS